MASLILINAFLTACGSHAYHSKRTTSTRAPRPLLLNQEVLRLHDSVAFVAHRARAGDAPENTLAAIKQAVQAKVELIEIDVRATKDKELIVMHDATLDRTTDAATKHGRGTRPEQLDLKAIQALDAGTWKDAAYANERVPTLDEAVAAIRAGSMPLIEQKSGDAQMYAAFLERNQLVGKVVIQSFDWNFLKELRSLLPDVALAGLSSESVSPEVLDRGAEAGINMYVWDQKRLDAQSIGLIQQQSSVVWAYTVDNAPGFLKLLRDGVNGVVTNVPRKLQAAYQETSKE